MVCHTGFCCSFHSANMDLNSYSDPVLVDSFSLFPFFSVFRYPFSTTLAVTSLAKSSVSPLPVRSPHFPVKNEEIHSVSHSCSAMRILSLWRNQSLYGHSFAQQPKQKRLLGQISALVGGPVCTMEMVDSVDWNRGDCHQLAEKGWLANPYLEKGGSF